MCGIAGFWGERAGERVPRMTRLLAHRGPDDEGVWASATAPVSLGNRRLKIIDLSSAGHQPMRSQDGHVVLTFNGEIYNHADLRAELRARGYMFRSQTDTEVLLATMLEWGTAGLARLKGMFAFALWDERKRSLLLVRDRLGIKPLYYSHVGDSFAFASEIRSLLSSGIRRPSLDRGALQSYLRLLWVPDPGTLFEGIQKLEPGTFLTWDGRWAHRERYWEVPSPVHSSVRHSKEGLRFLLATAVKRQLSADVPVGAFLSGGLDSTAVTGLATAAGSREVRSYTIGFSSSDRKGEGALDDLAYARLAAKHFRTNHHEIILAPRVVDLLPKMVRHLEDPVADPAAINCFLICQAARETSTVLLSGTGADELFGGYRKYVGVALGEAYRRYASWAGRVVAEPLARRLPVAVRGVDVRSFRLGKRFFRYAGLETFDRFAGYSSYYDSSELAALLGLDPGQADNDIGLRPLRDAWDRRKSGDLVDRMTFLDLKLYLPGLGLAYMDRASMAASVEVRVPLLDDDVVEYMTRLPGTAKVRGTRTKLALRAAMRGIVPDPILYRRKAPFSAPVRSWLRRDLAPLIDDLLHPRRLKDRGLLDPGMVQRLVAEHRSGEEDHSLRLWAFLTLEFWIQQFLDDANTYVEPDPEMLSLTTKGAL